jgi:hypothetical protein
MVTANADKAVIEIRPLTPPGRRPTRAWAAVIRESFLRADPQAGTLLMAEPPSRTWRPVCEWLLSLPATGRPDAVVNICLARYVQRVKFWDYPLWRMLLLDRTGQALAATREHDQKRGLTIWPAELFTPLRRVGIEVTEEQFANAAPNSPTPIPSIQSDSARYRL